MHSAAKMQPNEVAEEHTADDVDSTGSSSADNPRSNKPLMEKRRRARINKSLNELKTMLVQALKGNSCGHSKLEKADILEMTVRYMKKLEQHRARTTKIDPNVLNKYKAGFNECRNEVMKFLSTHEGVSVEVRTRLLDHLASCQQSLQDQDQEDLMGDEFMLAGVSSVWRQSPVSTDDSLSRVSPSAPHPTQTENEPTGERSSQDPALEEQLAPIRDYCRAETYVGGQIQIIDTEASTPATDSPSYRDSTDVLPRSTDEGDGAARATSRTYFHTLPQGSRDHRTLVMSAPQYCHHVEPLVQIVESRYARPNNHTTGEHLLYGVRNIGPDSHLASPEFSSKANSDESSTDASLSPELRPEIRSLVDYSHLELPSTSYRKSIEPSPQRRPKDLNEQRNTKGPWRPWSHEAK